MFDLIITTRFVADTEEKVKWIEELYKNLHALIDCSNSEMESRIAERLPSDVALEELRRKLSAPTQT